MCVVCGVLGGGIAFRTRPFLTDIEKKWITFQLLRALSQAHARGVCHGDIKCENVLVTSWMWIYLSDFACYKPTYIPEVFAPSCVCVRVRRLTIVIS